MYSPVKSRNIQDIRYTNQLNSLTSVINTR